MTTNKKTKERTGYFYEKEEQAVIDYVEATNNIKNGIDTDKNLKKKNEIYNDILHPALTKMIESIIRGYKLYVPDEEFQQTFSDTISYLMTKIDGYKQNKGTKAYSYCGTICKNYLLWKNMNFKKEQQRSVQYDDMLSDTSWAGSYYEDTDEFSGIADKLISSISTEIKNMISEPDKYTLTENEIKVGIALTDLLDNWQEVLKYDDESNKLQKSSVLYFLREETMMTTKEIRDNMKKYKTAYNMLKQAALE